MPAKMPGAFNVSFRHEPLAEEDFSASLEMTMGVSTPSSSRAELRAAMGINGNRSNETLSREISRGKAVVIIARRRFLDFARNDDGGLMPLFPFFRQIHHLWIHLSYKPFLFAS